jgi:D-alanine--poly(phosphoribitol) ligase subunit 2
VNRADIVEVILEAARELNESDGATIAVDQTDGAALYGRDGALDSVGLVSLVAAVEQALEDRFGVSIALADERAVSQKHSPFRTIGTLADYAASRAGVE